MNVYVGASIGGKARIVADLTLSEALVIWALRKHHEACRIEADPVGLDLSATFAKVFGHRQVSKAIEVFDEVVACFNCGARCQIRINPYAEECLSLHEEHFISILDALQQGELERASMLAQWLIETAYNATFLRHAHSFARLLSNAGHLLNGKSIAEAADRSKALSDGEKSKAPVVTQSEDLTLGESILLRGTRRWVACLHQEQEPFPVLQAHFAHYGIIDSAASLNAVLRNIAFAASRTVDIRGPSCPGVSPDETDLLHAVAGFQRADSGPAEMALANWMPPSAIRLTSGPLVGLADSLLAAGLILPLRERLADISPEERHARCWRSDSQDRAARTLH